MASLLTLALEEFYAENKALLAQETANFQTLENEAAAMKENCQKLLLSMASLHNPVSFEVLRKAEKLTGETYAEFHSMSDPVVPLASVQKFETEDKPEEDTSQVNSDGGKLSVELCVSSSL